MRKLWFALLISIVVAAIVGLTGKVVLPRNGKALGNIDPAKLITLTPTPTPSASASLPPSAIITSGYFQSKFSGKHLNKADWGTCYFWVDKPSGCTNHGNTEGEWYLPAQDKLIGGNLDLVATHQKTRGTPGKYHLSSTYTCRSGMVTTYPSFDFEYGLVRIIARIPNNPGLWSGLWLAPETGKWPPEIDILEHWGKSKKATGVFFHPANGIDQFQLHPKAPNLFTGWHSFALRWTPSELIWYIDGSKVATVTQFIPHQPMYFIADLADYDQNPGRRQCSGSLQIKSIQIWSKNATHPDATHPKATHHARRRGRKHRPSRARR
jgi:beta-glucanase (GH16 family)